MARYKKYDRFQCPEPSCGCEIQVTKGAPESCEGKAKPRCCCGRDMEKVV